MSVGKRILLLVFSAAVVLGLGSCTWVLSGLNHIDIDGERYDIANMELWYLGENAGVQVHMLIFTSEDMDVSTTNGADGSGTVMLLVAGMTGRDLVEGDYKYSDSADTFSFGGGFLAAGAEMTNDSLNSAEYDADLEGGQFLVRETLGGDFVIEFDFDGYDYESSQTIDVVGRFRGPVENKEDVSASALSTFGSVLRSRTTD